LPKKYHRPPTSKRRKAKKSVSYDFIPSPDATTVDTTAVGLEEPPPAPRETPEARDREERSERLRPASRQAVRDYSYVRDEVVRILALTAVVIVVLIIAGILR
jgi:hypothetical protein